MAIIRLKDAAVRGKNAANIASTGRRNIKTVSFPLFTNVENASWALQMALAEAANSLATLSLTVGRKAFQLKPGDLFILDYEPYDISGMVVRVLSIEEESLNSERFIVTVQEDINYLVSVPDVLSSTGKATFIQPELENVVHFIVEEPPYIYGETPNVIMPILSRQIGYEVAAYIYCSVDDGTSYSFVGMINKFAVYGELTSNLLKAGDTFDVEIEMDATYLESDSLSSTKETNLILIDDEIISFSTITPTSTENIYTISGLQRGLYDTAIDNHYSTASMYGRLEKLSNLRISYLEAGNTYKFKAIYLCPKGSTDLSEAISVDYEFVNRSLCPRSVNNLYATGGSSSSIGEEYEGDIKLSWIPRLRGSDEIPTELWECDGLFEVQVWMGTTNVRTARSIPTDQFFNSWTYTEEMNMEDYAEYSGISDSGLAPSVTFVVYNYIDENRYSEPAEITVTLESQTSGSVPVSSYTASSVISSHGASSVISSHGASSVISSFASSFASSYEGDEWILEQCGGSTDTLFFLNFQNGDCTDFTSNGNDFTAVNSPSYGNINDVYYIDIEKSLSQYVERANGPWDDDLVDGFSVLTLVNLESISSTIIFTCKRNYDSSVPANCKMAYIFQGRGTVQEARLYVWDNSVTQTGTNTYIGRETSGAGLTTGIWYLIAGVYNPSSQPVSADVDVHFYKLSDLSYYGGTVDVENNASNFEDMEDVDRPTQIGAYEGPTPSFDGKMGCVITTKKILTQSDVLAIAQNYKSRLGL